MGAVVSKRILVVDTTPLVPPMPQGNNSMSSSSSGNGDGGPPPEAGPPEPPDTYKTIREMFDSPPDYVKKFLKEQGNTDLKSKYDAIQGKYFGKKGKKDVVKEQVREILNGDTDLAAKLIAPFVNFTPEAAEKGAAAPAGEGSSGKDDAGSDEGSASGSDEGKPAAAATPAKKGGGLFSSSSFADKSTFKKSGKKIKDQIKEIILAVDKLLNDPNNKIESNSENKARRKDEKKTEKADKKQAKADKKEAKKSKKGGGTFYGGGLKQNINNNLLKTRKKRRYNVTQKILKSN
jgi:hypothetical protein